jgi:hypothetical protein
VWSFESFLVVTEAEISQATPPEMRSAD